MPKFRGGPPGANKSFIYSAEIQSLRLQADVAHYLPKAVKRAGPSLARICPKCGEHKAFKSYTCRACYGARREWRQTLKGGRPGDTIVAPSAHLDDRNFRAAFSRVGKVWHDHAQPTRPVMVKQADGTWAEEVAPEEEVAAEGGLEPPTSRVTTDRSTG